jgi:hypothetical protein
VAGTEAVKVLLGRGPLRPAPWSHQFDVYTGQCKSTKVRGGHRNPLQTVKRHLGYRKVRSQRQRKPSDAPREPSQPRSTVERILELARWAPSGDNNQPWRFEIVSDRHVRVHLTTPENDVYDLSGDYTVMSAGFLLETLRVAASRFGRAMRWSHRKTEAHKHVLDVTLEPDSTVTEDPRTRYVEVRSVDRRPYRTTPLTDEQKRRLEQALGDELTLQWHETPRERLRLSRLTALGTDIRLRIREAFEVHRRMIDFDRDRSPTGVPEKATGLDPLVRRALKWALADFRRVDGMNRILGTGTPQLEMDYVPGLASAAHFVVAFKRAPADHERTEALLRAGERLQRMWLEATRLGLAMQPALAPIAFGRYGVEDVPFTESPALRQRARRLGQRLQALWPERGLPSMTFAGRIGVPRSRAPAARSVRRPLHELLVQPADTDSRRTSHLRPVAGAA